MPFKNRANTRRGFTFIEIIVCVAIVAILAAIAIPSVYAFVENGRQTNRDNIARTLYLAAQKEMSELKLTKGLTSFSQLQGVHKMSELSSGQVDWKVAENYKGERDDIAYIIKNTQDSNSALNGDDPVDKLLDSAVIDDDVLKNSVCVEFNVSTGAIYSVFYSEILDVGSGFKYMSNSKDNSVENLSGDRPYKLNKDRKQGYYGGKGVVKEDMLNSFSIDIYDGANKPLKEAVMEQGFENGYKDILYAEILIPKNSKEGKYQLKFADKTNKEIPGAEDSSGNALTFDFKKNDSSLRLQQAINKGQRLIYRSSFPSSGNGEEALKQQNYYRYIWIIDLAGTDSKGSLSNPIGLDLYRYNPYSIAGDLGYPKLKPQTIKVSVELISDAGAVSIPLFSKTAAHSHFNDESVSKSKLVYGIKSLRHLNNIRYKLDGNYKQVNDIDLKNVYNMLPLTYYFSGKNTIKGGEFSGDYFALKSVNNKTGSYKIKNLQIQTPLEWNKKEEPKYVGLFGSVKGGSITGLSLDKASISASVEASENVGSLVGKLEGGSVSRCSSLSNVIVINGMPGASSKGINISVGGLVGYMRSGNLEQSYNGGYDVTGNINDPSGYGKVCVYGDNYVNANIGGLVGTVETGSLKNSYNNARVQVKGVTIDSNKLSELNQESYPNFAMKQQGVANIGGIAGKLINGTIDCTYATNYVGKTTYFSNPGQVNPEQCSTGGILGLNESGVVGENNFYIENGETDKGALSKQELASSLSKPSLGNNFSPGQDYPKKPFTEPFDTAATNYPYPVLKSNAHETNWENIKTVVVNDGSNIDNIKYYEIYKEVNPKTNQKYGIWSPNSDQLDYSQEVLQDGYVFYANNIDFKGNGVKKIGRLFVSDSPTGKNFIDKSDEKLANVDDLSALPGISGVALAIDKLEGASLGLNPVYVKVSQGNSDKKNYFEGYINPLFAKAIFKIGEKPTDNYAYSIRSPRHLDNIDFERAAGVPQESFNSPLKGKFLQEIDLNFENLNGNTGYRKVKDISKYVDNNNIQNLSFPIAAVKGSFLGTYNGTYKGKTNAIKNYSNLKAGPAVGNAPLGIFSQNGGTIKGLKVEKAGLYGGSPMGAVAGRNYGTIGGTGTNDGVQVVDSIITGSDKSLNGNIGGVTGVNAGTVNKVAVIDTAVTGGNPIGGIAGSNSGKISNVYYSYTSGEAILRSPQINNFISGVKSVAKNPNSSGGLVGEMSNTGSLTNAYMAGITDENDVKHSIGSAASASVLKDIYYLYGKNFNDSKTEVLPTVMGVTSSQLKEMIEKTAFPDINGWDTEKPSVKGEYPYPVLKGMSKPKTWNDPAIAVRYWEKYEGDKNIYFWNSEGKNSLKNEIVLREGYAITGLPEGDYTLTMGTENFPYTVSKSGILFISEQNVKSAMNDPASVDKPIEIGLVKSGGKKELLDETYINPLFAKQIFTKNTAQGNFEIRSPRQFINLYEFMGNPLFEGNDKKNFEQTTDINFKVFENDDGNSVEIGISQANKTFNGNYDGGGFKIINAKTGYKADGSGLFKDIAKDSIVKNMVLKNFSGLCENYAGTIASLNHGTIENIGITGTTDIIANGSYAGGIVGTNYGLIKSSYVSGASISASAYSAGAVGENIGEIRDVYYYSSEKVSTITYPLTVNGSVGGLVGVARNGSLLENAYFAAVLPIKNRLVFEVEEGSIVANLYLLKYAEYNKFAEKEPYTKFKKINELSVLSPGDLGDEEGKVWENSKFADYQYPTLKFQSLVNEVKNGGE